MDDRLRWQTIQAKVQETHLVRTVRLFRDRGLEPLIIKGWALARHYPQAEPRPASDIDLAFAPEDFPAAIELKNSNELRSVNLDCHCGLRSLDPTPWETIFARSRLVPLADEMIRVPADEDLFRISATHWLTDSGGRRDRLRDFKYLLEATNNFDWLLALESAGNVRKTWFYAVLAAARDFENLDAEFLPNELKTYELPKWFRLALEREWRRRPIIRGKLFAAWRYPSRFLELLSHQITESTIGQCIFLEEPIGNLPPRLIRLRVFVQKLKREFWQNGN